MLRMTATEFELSDRLGAVDGTVAMSGQQALLRVTADQQRADAARGLRTAGLIAGYRGSPLAGVDDVYEQNRAVLDRHDVRFISGVNEDLAATMIWGSQLAHLEADCRYDGVFGLWYGKGPGIDRSLDALRHGNISGIDPRGGVIAAVGDDPACKSSTVPSASEGVLADLNMPTLYPGSVQDVLDMGRWAYELSRFCGLWVGLKIHTDVADQYATVAVDPNRLPAAVRPDMSGWTPSQGVTLVPATAVPLEADAFGPRLDAARAFVAANGLDRAVGASTAKLGILAAGKAYADVRSGLAELGLRSDGDIAAAGIRVLKPAMIWPLEASALVDFAEGLEEIVVVEEKRSFLESQVRDLLFDLDARPRVTGKRSPEGDRLLPDSGALTADIVTPALRRRILAVLPDASVRAPRERIRILDTSGDLPVRQPYFCSGCPHNRSTVVPEGSVAGGGIGCHTMATWMDRDNEGLTHMGGEGAQWAGMSPFVSTPHRFQNIGDGTFFHSGSMALRQAISAGTNITYKVLYNGTVAMTGGQDAAGNMPIPDLTRYLEAEGVVRTVVVNEDAHDYEAALAANARIEHRDRYDAVQRELRDVPGVTVVVYDQRCAAELRRDRKRGRVETPTKRIFINESVCDGCGDCGRVSNCMSVHPVETAFGRKTRIHQESCNYDYSCVQGNCPAFIEVEIDPDAPTTRVGGITVPEGAPPPEPAIPDQATVLIVGIGGTGVVTVSQVLSTAALFDGREAVSLDQTGLAQKGGQVISNLKIGTAVGDVAARVGGGEADTALIFDVVGGTSADVLSRTRTGESAVVVSSVLLPTGTMVRELGNDFPELDAFRRAIEAATDPAEATWLDAEGIARGVFGSQPAANLIVVGIAYQRGLLPVSSHGIESAITQNGVAVEMNLEAFRLGRRLAVEPTVLAHLAESTAPDVVEPPTPTGEAAAIVDRIGGSARLRELVSWRVPELIAYQNVAYAQRYADVIARCVDAERSRGLADDISATVAFQLFKLMAYKDEYEVARLHLRDGLSTEIADRFGPGARFSYLLEPPTLKKLGRQGKSSIPQKAGRAVFTGLLRTKRLRGTRLDPFGRTEERRIERALVDEYPELVDAILADLTPENAAEGARILGLADQIRGFDAVKLANVERYRVDLAEALARWPG
ncbi:MAG: indolepyruvate ferredoxin oxidoreductase family protein [Actinomycetota bacterium]